MTGARRRVAGMAERTLPRVLNAWPMRVGLPLAAKFATLNLIVLALFLVFTWLSKPLRSDVVEVRIDSLSVKAEIIGNAISALTDGTEPAGAGTRRPTLDRRTVQAFLDTLDLPPGYNVQVFDAEGRLIALTGDPISIKPMKDLDRGLLSWLVRLQFAFERPLGGRAILPSRDAVNPDYPEVAAALSRNAPPGTAETIRETPIGDLIVSVARPIALGAGAYQGAILLSSEGAEIEALLSAQIRDTSVLVGIVVVALILATVYLHRTVAAPLHRLADAADHVRAESTGAAERLTHMPAFRKRRDEVGRLSGSLQDMTRALLSRIEAIEQFAADVAHEIKNPLTSLRSAVDTLDLAKTPEARARLLDIIKDDVGRLDRLISDISDASRLDAELARGQAEVVNVAALLRSIADIHRETRNPDEPVIRVKIESGALTGQEAMTVLGIESRLGQVVRNVLANAISFSPPGGEIHMQAALVDRPARAVVITVEDDGPGIPEDNLETIFQRFYTERPLTEDFGKNSGLGLSISRQIVDAHGGHIEAQNRRGAAGAVCGARFVITLPWYGGRG